MADPVSWLVIEPGWKVVDSNGEEVGRVEEVVGDEGLDIFDGLVIVTGLLAKPRYTPSEQVGTIREGEVQLELSAEEARDLPEYERRP
jgi:hypothetical protein